MGSFSLLLSLYIGLHMKHICSKHRAKYGRGKRTKSAAGAVTLIFSSLLLQPLLVSYTPTPLATCLLLSPGSIILRGLFSSLITSSRLCSYIGKNDTSTRQRQRDVFSLQMRLLILFPECISGVLRFATSLDPFGVFYTVDHFTARYISNAAVSVSAFTDLMMVVYCWDVFNTFTAVRRGKKRVLPRVAQHTLGVPVVILVGILLVLLDHWVLRLSLHGELGSAAIAIPTLISVLIYTFCCAQLVIINSLMEHEVGVISHMVAANKLPNSGSSTSAAADGEYKNTLISNLKSSKRKASSPTTTPPATGKLYLRPLFMIFEDCLCMNYFQDISLLYSSSFIVLACKHN